MSELEIKNGKFLSYKTYYKIVRDCNVKPLQTAIEECEKGVEGTFVIQDKKKPNYRAFVNIPYKDLPSIWDTDYCLSEVIHTSMPCKMFFDLDILEKDEEKEFYTEKFITSELVRFINMIDMGQPPVTLCDIAISKSRALCEKKRTMKLSYHIVFNNDNLFMNIQDYKVFTNELKYTMYKNGGSILIDMIDWCMGKENQVFKLPYQSKAGCSNLERIQKPMFGRTCVYDFIVSCGYRSLFGEFVFEPYSVEKCVGFHTKVSLQSHKTKKPISVGNFDLEAILIQYKNDIEYNYKDRNIFKDIIEPKLKDCPYGSLEYYLRSIPNDSFVSYDMFILIGMIIKRCCNTAPISNDLLGVQLWSEWTSSYGSSNDKSLSYQYSGFNSERGYGYKTIMNIAKIFNPLIGQKSKLVEPLFRFDNQKDWDKIQVDTDKLGTKIDIQDLCIKYDTLYVKSPMATGKSYMLRTIYEREPNASVLLLSCKRSFASAMAAEFKQYNFKNYMDIEMKSDCKNENRLICSIESIKYCREYYDYLIIDESESIAVNIIGGMNMKNNPIDNMIKFYNLVNNSEKVFVMDAYLCNRSKDMINDILRSHRKTVYIQNDFKPKKRYIKKTTEKKLVAAIQDKVNQKKECVFVCGSLKKQKNVIGSLLINEEDLKMYNKLERLDNSINVNTEWADKLLLSYTPTITAGVSYDKQPKDFLFMYLLNKGTCLMRDSIQAFKRVRNFRSPIIQYIMVNMPNEGDLPLTLAEVLLSHKNYIEGLERSYQDFSSCVSDVRLKYVSNLVMFCALEENLNEVCYKSLFQRFMDCENIEIVAGDKGKEKIDEIWSEDLNFDYEKCELVSLEEYQELCIEKEEYGRINDEKDFEKYMKYRYVNEIADRDIEYDKFVEIFNSMGLKDNLTYLFRSLRFNKFVNEVLVDNGFSLKENIDNYISTYTKAENRTELVEKYLLKYSYIIQYLNKLGFVKDYKIDWDHSYLTKDYDIVKDMFSSISFETLTQLFEEKNLRLKNVNERCIELKTSQLHSIFNNLLKEELKIESRNVGRKKIQGRENKVYRLGSELPVNLDHLQMGKKPYEGDKWLEDMNMYVKSTRGVCCDIEYNEEHSIPQAEPKQKKITFKFKVKKKST